MVRLRERWKRTRRQASAPKSHHGAIVRVSDGGAGADSATRVRDSARSGSPKKSTPKNKKRPLKICSKIVYLPQKYINIENTEKMDEDKNKSQEEKGTALSETWLYKTFIKSAEMLLAKPLAILDLAKRAVAHLFKYDSMRSLLADAKEKIGTIIRLVEAYARRQYREVSTRNIVLSIGALLYLVSPIDFIPDFLAAGLVDDVALLLWVYNNFSGEIEAFLRWEDAQKMRIELPEGDEKE